MKNTFSNEILNENNLRRFIHREIDSYLEKHYTPSNLQPSSKNQTFISVKMRWLKGEKTLYKLYEILKIRRFIICTWEEFMAYFAVEGTGIDMGVRKKIRWIRSNKNLIRLFIFLKHKRFIDQNLEIKEILFQHFSDKNGDDFKSGSFRTSLSEINKEKMFGTRFENVIEIVSQLETLTHN